MNEYARNEIYKLVRELLELTKISKVSMNSRLSVIESLKRLKMHQGIDSQVVVPSSLTLEEIKYYKDLHFRSQARIDEIMSELDGYGVTEESLGSKSYIIDSSVPYVWAKNWLINNKDSYDPEFIKSVEANLDSMMNGLTTLYGSAMDDKKEALVNPTDEEVGIDSSENGGRKFLMDNRY